jgi:hypothetical protein
MSMAFARLLFAPALLAAAVLVAGGERHRAPRPAPAGAQVLPGPASIEPAAPHRAGREGASPRRARSPR